VHDLEKRVITPPDSLCVACFAGFLSTQKIAVGSDFYFIAQISYYGGPSHTCSMEEQFYQFYPKDTDIRIFRGFEGVDAS
jgi:hypothetical protein